MSSISLPSEEDYGAHGLHLVVLDPSSSSSSSSSVSTDREARITGTARLIPVEAYPLGERWRSLPAGEVKRVRFR